MIKRGPLVAICGIVMILISLVIAIDAVPTDSSVQYLTVPSLFEGMFNKVSNEIQIMPDESASFSYSTVSSNVPIMWGAQILDFESDDVLEIKITNIFDDMYGKFTQRSPIVFKILQIEQSDTLNFELRNLGADPIVVMLMVAEDPENSDLFSNPDSPVVNTVLPLLISGFLLIIGIIVSVIGAIVIVWDIKNNQNNRKFY